MTISFQAEDGIRDFHVTGVQTCALPISRRSVLIRNAAMAASTRIASRPSRNRITSELVNATCGDRVSPSSAACEIGRESCRESLDIEVEAEPFSTTEKPAGGCVIRRRAPRGQHHINDY